MVLASSPLPSFPSPGASFAAPALPPLHVGALECDFVRRQRTKATLASKPLGKINILRKERATSTDETHFDATSAPQVAKMAICGPSWSHLGASWGHVGPTWRHLGAMTGLLGASWGLWRPFWGHLWPAWGHDWAILGPSWGLLGPLGASLGPLGTSGSHRCSFNGSTIEVSIVRRLKSDFGVTPVRGQDFNDQRAR